MCGYCAKILKLLNIFDTTHFDEFHKDCEKLLWDGTYEI
jgi:hypothetical protein